MNEKIALVNKASTNKGRKIQNVKIVEGKTQSLLRKILYLSDAIHINGSRRFLVWWFFLRNLISLHEVVL